MRERDLARGGRRGRTRRRGRQDRGMIWLHDALIGSDQASLTNSDNDRRSHKRLLTSVHLLHRSRTGSTTLLGTRFAYEACDGRGKSVSRWVNSLGARKPSSVPRPCHFILIGAPIGV